MATNGSESGVVPAIDTARSAELEAIAVNPDWLYQPDEMTDLNDLRKNPIPFVGVGEDARLGDLFENHTVQPKYESAVEVKIADLLTLQPFVLQSGIDNYIPFDSSERPYVVEFEGKLYLIDGNHRVAKAKLDGKKTVVVDVSHLVMKP